MMKIIRWLLILETVFLLGIIKTDRAVAQKPSVTNLCNKFPLNSRCTEKNVALTQSKKYRLNRDNFCQNFSFNSRCQKEPVKIITMNLDRSGEDDEWIRIEQNGDRVRLLHTTKVRDNLASTIIDGVVGLIPYPIPLDTSKYDWEDHQVIKVAFKSNSCRESSCTVVGKKALKLPPGTNIHQGLFTIEYQEKELIRSVSFRIPDDVEISTNNTIFVEVPQSD